MNCADRNYWLITVKRKCFISSNMNKTHTHTHTHCHPFPSVTVYMQIQQITVFSSTICHNMHANAALYEHNCIYISIPTNRNAASLSPVCHHDIHRMGRTLSVCQSTHSVSTYIKRPTQRPTVSSHILPK